ncbi:hypothetical protein NM688_g12 [Phlebia brevispora]|uniref:Uncharacterized protein n=1 Tax=Phlebia brevispora TaxID=194682 RepID=A0ACC1TGA9_9APHY|nr:hypothetical protein NM688_g12 [Phlebia brevispora]
MVSKVTRSDRYTLADIFLDILAPHKATNTQLYRSLDERSVPSSPVVDMSDDVLFYVAQNVTSRKDLRAMSLSSRAFRAPAQKELYRHLTRTIKTRYGWHDPLLQFLRDHPVPASYINSFVIRNQGLLSHPRINISMLWDIVEEMAGLRHLSITGIDWTPAPDFGILFSPKKKTFLRHISLLGMNVISPAASPLQILHYTQDLLQLDVEAIAHPSLALPPFRQPVTVNVFNLLHFPVYQNVLTIPSTFDIIQNVVNLTARYIHGIHLIPIANILSRSHGTLQSLKIRTIRFDTFRSAEEWDNILLQLRSCQRLVKLYIYFSVGSKGDARNASAAHDCTLQSSLLRRFLNAVKGSVRCLDFVFELRGSSKDEAIRNFLGLRWEMIGNEAALAKSLEVVRIRLTTYDDILLRWHPDQFQAVSQAFPQLPNHYGINALNDVQMAHAPHGDQLQPFHYVPADFMDHWSWESTTTEKPVSRYLCVKGQPVTFDVLGTIEKLCLEDEEGRPYSVASVTIQPRWPLDAEVLYNLCCEAANPMRGSWILSPPKSVTASKCMSVRYSVQEPWQIVPFKFIFDARDVPYGVHWSMPMLRPDDVKVGDDAVMECRIFRFRHSSMPKDTWETGIELMALTLVETRSSLSVEAPGRDKY